MKIERIWSIYFSPVGSTAKVANETAATLRGLFGSDLCRYDFTLPKARESFPELNEKDLVIFATPTYAGRVPNVLLKYLKTIVGNGALAIPIVTFGNRNYDNSLIELRDILENAGFHTIAAIAASTQHSFSYELGKGRPDMMDLMEIRRFCTRVYNGISTSAGLSSGADRNDDNLLLSPVKVPGIPETYGGYYQPQDRNGVHIDIRKVTPKVSEACINCGYCVDVCPMGSIVPGDVTKMQGICIKCNACYKKCPQKARYFDDEGYLYHKEELEDLYKRRADNRFFMNA